MSNVLYKCLKSRFEESFKLYNLYTIKELQNVLYLPKVVFLEPNEYLEHSLHVSADYVFSRVEIDNRYIIHTGMTPVHGEMFIEVVQRDGTHIKEYASNILWCNRNKNKDVVAYKVISIPGHINVHNKLTELEKENEELRKQLKEYEKENTFPQVGDRFYYIDAVGRVLYTRWGNLGGSEYDIKRFTGIYKTKKEAELVAKAIQEFVEEHNE